MWLLLVVCVFRICYSEQKPEVRISDAAGSLRLQDLNVTHKKGPNTVLRAGAFERLLSNAAATWAQPGELQQAPTPPTPPCTIPIRARPTIGASINKLFMATFGITTCYADLKPGHEFEPLLGIFVIATC